MEKEVIDLRNLIFLINEHKEINANFSMDYNCQLEVEDYKPLVKVINYAINYIGQLTNQEMQINLNAGEKFHMLVLTAYTEQTEFPPISEKVTEVLQPYNATISLESEPGKYAQIQLKFNK